MSEGGDLVGHIQRFNQVCYDLLKIDVKIEEEDRALFLLCSLPLVYDHLITTLVYSKKFLEYEKVVGALRSNEQRKKIYKGDTTSEAFTIHKR